MKERGIWRVPQAYLWDAFDPTALPEAVRRKAEAIAPRARRSEMALKSGVKIAFSTDGPLPKDDAWREFVALVTRGMTPTQAIQRATIGCRNAGSRRPRPYSPGIRADLVAISGDPSRTIEAMQGVKSFFSSEHSFAALLRGSESTEEAGRFDEESC